MGSEELLAKRILRLTGYLKDTREPRGPEHMAKMKAARGPYSDPRDTHIASMIRYAFERSDGKPVSTAQLVEEIYGWQLRLKGKAKQSYHYEAIRRALRKVANQLIGVRRGVGRCCGSRMSGWNCGRRRAGQTVGATDRFCLRLTTDRKKFISGHYDRGMEEVVNVCASPPG